MTEGTKYYGNFIEGAYLFNILLCYQLKGYYNSFEYERIELHNKLAEKYSLTRQQVATITDHLDKKIGFDFSKDYSESELCALGEKLKEELTNLSKENN